MPTSSLIASQPHLSLSPQIRPTSPWYRLFAVAEIEPDVSVFDCYRVRCPGIKGVVQVLELEVG